MLELIKSADDLVWGWLLFLLLGTGLFFTFKTRGLQFRRFTWMFRVMLDSFRKDAGGVSSFQAYCTSLAGRVGTGNLAGVAIAVHEGGPGAVFWMWVVAMLGMITACVESSLAQLYKIPDSDGAFRGGPAYYMERGLNKRWMGVIFSLLLLLCYGFVFNAVQSDSIANAMGSAFSSNDTFVGITLIILTALIIFGGIKRIAKFAEFVVPIMALAYLAIAFLVVFLNITEIPSIVLLIVKSAFNLEKVAAGALGYTISRALTVGAQRGLFSNEAGMGSTPNAAATATVKHPVEQGFAQMLGVFTDTIVICTSTAFIVIISGKYTENWGEAGISLTQTALTQEVGSWGSPFIAVALFFFAFTSIVANYYYGETSLRFIDPKKRFPMWIYRLLVLGVVYFGVVAQPKLVWTMANLSMGLMATVNLIAILMLTKPALALMRDYDDQLLNTKKPELSAEVMNELGLTDSPWLDEKPE